MAYPSGRLVLSHRVVRRERWPGGYKVRGIPLVSYNQEVVPDQPVLRLEREDVHELVDLPTRLLLPTITARTKAVETGEVSPSFSPPTSPASQTSQDIFVPAGVYGRVTSLTQRGGVVIESYATVIQGTLGAGKQVAGPLTIWQGASSTQGPQIIPPGAILVVPGTINFPFLRQALNSGVSGIVASSISLSDLEGFLRTDLLQLLISRDPERMQVHLPPLTIFLTEGVGNATMPAHILNLLNQYQGTIVLLAGMTSTQQHIFPELLISLPNREAQSDRQAAPLALSQTTLATGVQVRICSGDYEGMMGVVDYLFTHQQAFSSGIRAPAVRLRLEDGSLLVVPITLIERIG